MTPIITVIVGIAVLLILIIRFKVNAFIGLLLVSIGIGLAQGLTFGELVPVIQKGVGSTLGYLALVLGLGAILGGILVDSGAADAISGRIIHLFGKKHLPWAMALTGFIIGIPLFYTVGFVMLIPIIFTVGRRLDLPLVYVGIPTICALSVTHGFLPPHPAPTTISLIYEADMGLTLVYGLLIAFPSMVIAGPFFARTLKSLRTEPVPGLVPERDFAPEDLPPLGLSLFVALIPILLMGTVAVFKLYVPETHSAYDFATFIGDPVVALLIAVIAGGIWLGLARGMSMLALQKTSIDAVKGISMILLVIAGGGALKQVLVDSGISDYIVGLISDSRASPVLLTWLIAAALRISLGSATVAALTAAGIVAPLAQQAAVSPEVLVLATGAGSLTCSQVNDTGFWLFKEYFNLSILDTFRTWTVMETIISVCGLAGCLLLNAILT